MDTLGADRVRKIEMQGKPKSVTVGAPKRVMVQAAKKPELAVEPEEDFDALRKMLLDTQSQIDAIL